MRIDDLPRLTDEERAALDGYTAMQGVPAISIDDLVAQRTAALYAMRTAGDYFAAFSRASHQEAQLAAQIRRTRRQATDAACLDCHGSGLDPAEGTRCERCEGSGNRSATSRPTVAALLAQPDRLPLTEPNRPCRPQPEGNCRQSK